MFFVCGSAKVPFLTLFGGFGGVLGVKTTFLEGETVKMGGKKGEYGEMGKNPLQGRGKGICGGEGGWGAGGGGWGFWRFRGFCGIITGVLEVYRGFIGEIVCLE